MIPYRHQKKSIIRDAKTGQEYTLRAPRYGVKKDFGRRQCLGGCRPALGPRTHDSVEEMHYCNKLRILKKVGEVREYQAQVTYPITDREGNSCGNMRVDFLVTMKGGGEEIHEYKGRLFETLREFRLARALFSWCYPDLIYKTVTERDLI